MSGSDSRPSVRSRQKRVWYLPYPAVGKPRMTQRDKWMLRPVVDDYRTWCDLVRLTMDDVPSPEEVYLLVIEARYQMPRKWPKRRRRVMLGTLKRTAPDPDNIAKAFMDCWWPKNDAGVGDVLVRRRWWESGETVVTMWLSEEVLLDGKVEEPEKQ